MASGLKAWPGHLATKLTQGLCQAVCEVGGGTDTENSSTPWAKRGLVGSTTNACKDLWVNF